MYQKQNPISRQHCRRATAPPPAPFTRGLSNRCFAALMTFLAAASATDAPPPLMFLTGGLNNRCSAALLIASNQLPQDSMSASVFTRRNAPAEVMHAEGDLRAVVGCGVSVGGGGGDHWAQWRQKALFARREATFLLAWHCRGGLMTVEVGCGSRRTADGLEVDVTVGDAVSETTSGVVVADVCSYCCSSNTVAGRLMESYAKLQRPWRRRTTTLEASGSREMALEAVVRKVLRSGSLEL